MAAGAARSSPTMRRFHLLIAGVPAAGRRSPRCGSRAWRDSTMRSAAAGTSRTSAPRTVIRNVLRVVVIAAMRGPALTTDRVRDERTRS